MYEPKLLARLDSIKHHLMSGMATPYVIDEIECLQRDIEAELRVNSHPRVQDHLRSQGEDKPGADFTISVSGLVGEIKNVKLVERPLDSAWDRINRGDYDELKVIDVHMPSGRTIKTPLPIKHFAVAPLVIKIKTPGPEPEPKPDWCNGLEYIDGPVQAWVTTLKINPKATHGDKQ